jgi:hypothetical protein
MAYDTITVPEFDTASSLNLTDWLWLTQGTGTDRNKKTTLQQLKDLFYNELIVPLRVGFLEGYFKNDSPAVFGDRLLLLVGQVIDITGEYANLASAVYCGDADNATAPCFYKTSDAGGTTRSTSGTYMVMPDGRGLSWKGLGDAIINGRTKVGPVELGEVQEDQGQGHYHSPLAGAFGILVTAAVSGGGSAYYDCSGASTTGSPTTDGTNGPVRAGTNTRDSTIGTNWGIGY